MQQCQGDEISSYPGCFRLISHLLVMVQVLYPQKSLLASLSAICNLFYLLVKRVNFVIESKISRNEIFQLSDSLHWCASKVALACLPSYTNIYAFQVALACLPSYTNIYASQVTLACLPSYNNRPLPATPPGWVFVTSFNGTGKLADVWCKISIFTTLLLQWFHQEHNLFNNVHNGMKHYLLTFLLC